MFTILPQECLLLILHFIHKESFKYPWEDSEKLSYDEWYDVNIRSGMNDDDIFTTLRGLSKDTLKRLAKGIHDSHNINWPNYIIYMARLFYKRECFLLWNEPLPWKQQRVSRSQKCFSYSIQWTPSPFRLLLPFINLTKENKNLLDTELVWTSLLLKDFKLNYNIDQPSNAKNIYIQNMKSLIYKRHKETINNLEEKNKELKKRIIFHSSNLNLLLNEFQRIKTLQVDSDIFPVNSISPLSIPIPNGYQDPDKYYLEHNITQQSSLSIHQAMNHTATHESRLLMDKKFYLKNDSIIQKWNTLKGKLNSYSTI